MSTPQVHTKFSHLTTDELTRLVSSCECTQLEVELASRLVEAANELRELSASMRSLPPLSSLQLHLLADHE